MKYKVPYQRYLIAWMLCLNELRYYKRVNKNETKHT